MNIVSRVERDNYFKSLRNSLKGKKFEKISVVLCVPAIHLESFLKNIKNKNISFGIQDGHWENKGAFTGETSLAIASDLGAGFVIVGHSERRKHFHESNQTINAKLSNAFKNNLIPIFCIGENLEEKESGKTKEIILREISEGLDGISRAKISKMIIAYEPIWSISTSGTGRLPKSEEIMSAKILIQKILMDKFGLSVKQMPSIIYGGSVNYRNINETCLEPNMGGVLVGGESLHPDSFMRIAENIEHGA